MPLPTAPDWLTKRDGKLTPGLREHIVFVTMSAQPQYKLEVRPAMGQYECLVIQTVNGRLLDSATAAYPTLDAAFAGGLERLKNSLGW